jgi:hypothetical protein
MNAGPQPLEAVMASHDLNRHALVAASTEHLTHKEVGKACKGRKLTLNLQTKIQRALTAACGVEYPLDQLFTYRGR